MAEQTIEGQGLTAGTVSDEVELVQALLTDISNTFGRTDFNPGPINGVYGNQTASAVSNVQAALGMNPTGVVDDNTYSAISALWEGDPSTVSFYTAPSDSTVNVIAPGTPPPAATSTTGVNPAALPSSLPATLSVSGATANVGPNWMVLGVLAALAFAAYYFSSQSPFKGGYEEEEG